MKTIRKYKLPVKEGFHEIETHSFSQILSVGVESPASDPKPVCWVKVDTSRIKQKHRVYISYTGTPLPYDAYTFIGTVRVEWLVLHIFDAPYF